MDFSNLLSSPSSTTGQPNQGLLGLFTQGNPQAQAAMNLLQPPSVPFPHAPPVQQGGSAPPFPGQSPGPMPGQIPPAGIPNFSALAALRQQLGTPGAGSAAGQGQPLSPLMQLLMQRSLA